MDDFAIPSKSYSSTPPDRDLDMVQVLLVEDNPADAGALQQWLAGVKTPRFGLVHVETLADALICLGEYTIDVILLALDCDRDLELKSLCQLQTRRPGIPIVTLTDCDNLKVATQILQRGAQDHLVKGEFDGKGLARAIRYAIERKRAQTALRERENQYRNFFEEAPIAFWEEDFSEVKMFIEALYASGVTDLREHFTNHPEMVAHCASLVKIINVNRVTVESYQADSKEELLGTLDQFFVSESYAAFRDELIALATGDTDYHTENIGRTSTGETTYNLIRLTVAPGCEDTWSKVFVTALDITEQKLAEEALRESELRFRSVAESSPDAIISIDSSGKVLSWNSGAQAIFGYSEAEILGQSIAILIPEANRAVFHEGMAHMRDTGKMPDMVDRTTEWQGVHKDGSLLPMELSVGTWKTNGERVFSGIIRDISDRKQAESALKMWWEIFENAQWGVMVSSPESNVLEMINPAFAQMHGYSVHELAGTPVANLFAPGYRDALPDHIRILKEEGNHTFESAHVRKDGSIFPVLINATAVKDNTGKILYRVGNIQDLTEYKKLEDAATHAYLLEAELEKEKAIVSLKERFVSIVSHEFRTPLAVIQTANDMLTRYFDRIDAPKRLQLLQQIKDQTIHISRLIDDTLEISRATNSQPELDRQPTNLETFCQSILEQVRFVDNGQHVFEFNSSVPDTPTLIDVSMVHHILTNLLSNAIKYSEAGSTIHFDVSCEADQVIFQVMDEGIGIPEEDLQRLYEPFHRGTNVGEVQGTGLGLSIARQYAESHGGALEISSEEGNGTTATVRLPLHYTRI